MENRTMMVRTTNWARIIEECNNSGKTVAEFCKEHNIAKSTYYLWQQRIRGMILDKAFDKIYIALGYTDLRCGIDGLAAKIHTEFELSPFQENVLFLFCGRSSNKIKGLL